jgi:hypothetical protein
MGDMRRSSALIVFMALIVSTGLLSGCRVPGASSPPQSAPPAAPSPSGIAAADQSGPLKVAAMLFPDTGRACGHDGHYSSCPVTPDLAHRLAAGPVHYAEQFCRCTGLYRAPKFAVTPIADGAVVRVDLALDKGQQSLDLTLVRTQGIWVVSDVTCAGRGTSTSLFSDSPSLCFATSG